MIRSGVMLTAILILGPAAIAPARARGPRSATFPFELDHGIIYTRATVNGSPPRSFILDTGASYVVLDLSLANTIGLARLSVGTIEGGAGAHPPEAFRVTDAVTIGLPGVDFPGQDVVTMALDKIDDCTGSGADGRLGRPIDGILGKPFFDRFVVEIDYATRQVMLHDPRTYEYHGRGAIISLDVKEDIYVRAQVKTNGRRAVQARLIVDTGASAPLALERRFTDAHALLPPTATLEAMKNCGIGGKADETSWMGAVDSIAIGRMNLPRPVTVFVRGPGNPDRDGTLGNGALVGFRVIFDYAHRRMILDSR